MQEAKLINMDKRYRTRDGRPVRILCIDRKSPDYPVIALILDNDGVEFDDTFTATGRQFTDSTDRALDLIEVSPYDGFKVNDPVMIRDFTDQCWDRRYFAGVDKEGKATSFINGLTSWTTSQRASWNQCRRPTPNEMLDATPT